MRKNAVLSFIILAGFNPLLYCHAAWNYTCSISNSSAVQYTDAGASRAYIGAGEVKYSVHMPEINETNLVLNSNNQPDTNKEGDLRKVVAGLLNEGKTWTYFFISEKGTSIINFVAATGGWSNNDSWDRSVFTNAPVWSWDTSNNNLLITGNIKRTTQILNHYYNWKVTFPGGNQEMSVTVQGGPPDEYKDHNLTYSLTGARYIIDTSGPVSPSGITTIDAKLNVPVTVSCSRQATPITFLMTPTTVDFGNVITTSVKPRTQSLRFDVTSGAQTPSATLTFKQVDSIDGKLSLGGGLVSFTRDSDQQNIRMNEPFSVTDRTMDFTATLEAKNAKPGIALATMNIDLTIN